MTHELLYYGPPGTGKTQNISNLIRGALEEGIPPERIACVSFTRKAASESRERVCKNLGLTEDMLPYFQTLHSMAFHAGGYKRDDLVSTKDLKEIGNDVGLSFSPVNTKKNETDFDTLGISHGDQYLSMYHLARSKRMPVEEVYRLSDNYDLMWPELKRLIRSYEAFKKARGKIDFTDMIEKFVENNQPLDIDALFVDEAQDLSTLQWEMISVLRQTPRIQVFTGDDDQAIMGFQGADVRAFQNCARTTKVLTQSYRLPQKVYEVAQTIVRRVEGSTPKVWYPPGEMGSVNWHTRLEDVPLEEGVWCLMARTNRIASLYAEMLREQGWVFSRFGHPSIPPKMYEAILDWQSWCKGQSLSPVQVRNIYSFMEVEQGFRRMYGPRSKNLLDLEEDCQVSMEHARMMLGLLAPSGIWHEQLTKVDTDNKHYILNALKRGDNVKNPRIKVSTIHSMKGGECDNVLLIPDLSYAAYKEYRTNPSTEHRVFYVGVTRTKQNLHLMEPIIDSKRYYEI